MALLGGIARGLAAGYVGHTTGKLEAGERRRQRQKEEREETYRQEDREDRRRAREAEAHLDAIRLSTEQIRAQAALRKDDDVNWQTVETPDGYVQVNPRTGEKRRLGIRGMPRPVANISDDDRRQARAEELIRGGMDPDEAYRQANARYPRHQGLTAEQMLEVLGRLSAGRTGATAPPPAPRR